MGLLGLSPHPCIWFLPALLPSSAPSGRPAPQTPTLFWHFPPSRAAETLGFLRRHPVCSASVPREEKTGEGRPGPAPWEEHLLVSDAAAGLRPSRGHRGCSSRCRPRHRTAPCLKGPGSPTPRTARLHTNGWWGKHPSHEGGRGMAVTTWTLPSTPHPTPNLPKTPRRHEEFTHCCPPGGGQGGPQSSCQAVLPPGPPGPAPGCCKSPGW